MRAEIERLKEEAGKEMEGEVEKVKRTSEKREDEISREFLSKMEQMRKGLKDVEAKYDELVKWKVMMEEGFEKIEKDNNVLVEEVRELREMNEELKKQVGAEKGRVLEL
ncbi:hypothetical protein QQ045_009367 [Rhodiola kirilowii]